MSNIADDDEKMGQVVKNKLSEEFYAWKQNQTNHTNLELKQIIQQSDHDNEGKVTLKLSIGPKAELFTLICPLNYPDYEQESENFFVESMGINTDLQVWCNALNEYLLDSGRRLTLANILNKGISLFASNDSVQSISNVSSENNDLSNEDIEDQSDYDSAMDDDDFNEDEEEFNIDGQMEDILDENLEKELEIGRRKKNWKLKEAQLRAEKDAENLQDNDESAIDYTDPSSSLQGRPPKQVFSSTAASGILTNDLLSIMDLAADAGIIADSVDDNIFQWNVKMKNFTKSDTLASDCQELRALHGYDYIELQLDFSMNLYPFFPPSLKVIRPRLQGSLMFGVTNVDCIKLSFWNPAQDMKTVLEKIKDFIQTWARLDVQSERNDFKRYPEGSYNYLEHYLQKLAFISECTPRANKKYLSTETPKMNLPSSAIEDVFEKSEETPKESPDEPKEEKKSLTEKASELIYNGIFGKSKMAKGVGYSHRSSEKGWDAEGWMAAQKEKDRQTEQLLQKILREIQDLNQVKDENRFEEYYDVLEGSALVPFLEYKLRDNSFLEICNHATIYQYVIQIIKEFVCQKFLVSLVGTLQHQPQSLKSLVSSLGVQAQMLLKTVEKAPISKDSEKTTCVKMAQAIINLNKEIISKKLEINDVSSEAVTINGEDDDMDQKKSEESDNDYSAAPAMKKYKNDVEDIYKKSMKELQLIVTEFDLSGLHRHHFANSFSSKPPSSATIFRVAQELSSLSTALPLEFSSAIFLQTDDDKPTIIRVMITGPEDTPYSGGCFLFDIFFPGTFPDKPPEVNFRTTGNGSVRFNPNLYNNGKVCLSLLGTWAGAKGEEWNVASTVLQVLVSIQSLILCSEPYFNEPGYQGTYGTKDGNAKSLKYSEEVFLNNLKHAVLGQISNPPKGFENMVKTHFYLKKDSLLEEYEKLAQKFNSPQITKELSNVRLQFEKLQMPKV